MNISTRMQVSAEALAQILLDGTLASDTALEAAALGIDLNSLFQYGKLIDIEIDALLEGRDEPVFDMTPSGEEYVFVSIDEDDDPTTH